jgi:hypothetical protein
MAMNVTVCRRWARAGLALAVAASLSGCGGEPLEEPIADPAKPFKDNGAVVWYAPHLTKHGGPVIANPVVYTLAWDDDAFGWDQFYDETGAGKAAMMDWMSPEYGVSSATSAWAGIKLSGNATAWSDFHSLTAPTHACSFGCCAEDCNPGDLNCYAKLALGKLIQSGGAAPSAFPLGKQSSYYAVHVGNATSMGNSNGWHDAFVRTNAKDTCGKQRFVDPEFASPISDWAASGAVQKVVADLPGPGCGTGSVTSLCGASGGPAHLSQMITVPASGCDDLALRLLTRIVTTGAQGTTLSVSVTTSTGTTDTLFAVSDDTAATSGGDTGWNTWVVSLQKYVGLGPITLDLDAGCGSSTATQIFVDHVATGAAVVYGIVLNSGVSVYQDGSIGYEPQPPPSGPQYVASHEILEAATDPLWRSGAADIVDNGGGYWDNRNSPSFPGPPVPLASTIEICDICEGTVNAWNVLQYGSDQWTVATGWSNALRICTTQCSSTPNPVELVDSGTFEPSDPFQSFLWLDTTANRYEPGSPPASMWVTGDSTHACSGNGYLQLGVDPLTGKPQGVRVTGIALPGSPCWTSALWFNLGVDPISGPTTGDAFVVTVQSLTHPANHVSASFAVDDLLSTFQGPCNRYWVDLGEFWNDQISVTFSVTEGTNPATFRLDNVSIR